MADKEIVQDQQQRMTDDGQRELFVAAVRQDLSELDNGDSVPIEEVEKQLPSWIK